MTLQQQAEDILRQMTAESWWDSVDRLETILSERDKLRAALEVYANKSMWVSYERDGEITASIFTADESGQECGVLCDGWLFARAALAPKENGKG